MNRIQHILLSILCIFSMMPLSAKTVDPQGDSLAIAKMRAKMDQIRKYRPTVALVLSGGGAKGAAHVGAIKYIEQLDIPVDMVLGTSIGGLVGGLYSLGYPVEEIDSLMTHMDWNWVLSDELSRDYISYTDMKYKALTFSYLLQNQTKFVFLLLIMTYILQTFSHYQPYVPLQTYHSIPYVH